MPQVASIVPPVLTCLVGRRLGDPRQSNTAQYPLRDLAASLIGLIASKYGKTSQTLKPRLARSCLKHFLDPNKTLGVHYGAIGGLVAVGGAEAVRVLILPNLKAYESVLRDELQDNAPRRGEAEIVVQQILKSLDFLESDSTLLPMTNGTGGHGGEALKDSLNDKIGTIIGTRVAQLRKPALMHAIVAEDSTKLRGNS